MPITSARNPSWGDAGHTHIKLIIIHETYGEIPFSAAASDVEPHGAALFAAAVAGDFGLIAGYAAPIKTPAEIAAARKAEIISQLSALDVKSIRPLREGDAARVAALDAQSEALRAELAALS